MTDISLKSEGKTGAGTAVLARFAEKGANSFGAVRLLAAIAVIATHSVAVVGGYHSLEPLRALTGLSLGTHAVHVFFALSGFMVLWGFKLVSETMGQTLSDLPGLPVGISYLPLPLGSLVTIVFILEKMAFGSQHERPICRLEHQADEIPVTAADL